MAPPRVFRVRQEKAPPTAGPAPFIVVSRFFRPGNRNCAAGKDAKRAIAQHHGAPRHPPDP